MGSQREKRKKEKCKALGYPVLKNYQKLIGNLASILSHAISISAPPSVFSKMMVKYSR
jgi:hypothetical protein